MAKVILVVDDDDDVRETAVNLVVNLGYRVAAAANANDALRFVINGGIDAVFTDVMMPGVNGFQLARCIRAVEPGMPVVCVTGYAGIAEDARHYDVLLQKPYRAATVEETLKSVLGA